MKEVQERIAALENERAELLSKGLSIKNIEEALVDEKNYLHTLEAKAEKETKKPVSDKKASKSKKKK